ncbi:PEP-CTERM sorting domain-containing protein [Quisquiliibacterium transsilvanicum]|jgi:hypothetical protein|uniref:Ice-binding protein C-terminal domain-containing protein n=1 Tax=Quisquiliibacterium transsilvanicum TaxID=1549638 RepID=A0A7W8HGH2_9BURK|nr:PEP-CTERM sorting domain-containing protein [Quisquiliibacterium transsilvanicum]MBB5271652.1 hypothetical protein [Quisquiliibacterium transsilvanicum]
MKTMPFAMVAAAAAVAGFMLVDASHADVRERRTRTTAPAQQVAPAAPAPAPAPTPAAGPAGSICYVTEVLPAAPVSVPVISAPPPPVPAGTDGRQRRSRTVQAVAEVAPAPAPQPIVITRAVPCPEAPSAEAPGSGSYTPGLLSPPLLAGEPTPGIDPLLPGESTGITQVPEPSVLALFGVGALGLAIARRRRRG